MTYRQSILVSLCGMLFSASLAQAATYYLVPGGSGTACSQSNPCGQASTALGKMGAGDTLLMHGGVYAQEISTNTMAVPSGTSWSNPVTIAAVPGETPVLMGRLVFNPAAYILVKDLVIDGANASGTAETVYQGSGAHHIRIVGGEIRNAAGQGVQNGDGGKGLEYIGIKVHGNGRNLAFDLSKNHGFYVSASEMLIDGCEFYNNSYYGIQVYHSGGTSSTNTNSIIRNNYIHNNGAGVNINMSTNLQFYNNVVVHNETGGVEPLAYGNPTGTQIWHNTIAFNGGIGLEIQSGARNTTYKNNIIYGNATNIDDRSDSSTQSNNWTSNPRFVGSGDFRLQEGSPAIDAGATLPDIPGLATDMAGGARPRSSPDAGAYEYGSTPGTVPPGGVPPPSGLPAPTGATVVFIQ